MLICRILVDPYSGLKRYVGHLGSMGFWVFIINNLNSEMNTIISFCRIWDKLCNFFFGKHAGKGNSVDPLSFFLVSDDTWDIWFSEFLGFQEIKLK